MPQRQKSKDTPELAPQPSEQDAAKKPRGDEPQSRRRDEKRPEQVDDARPPPPSASGVFERKDTSGRWGMLPPKEAEDLQRRNADEFPQRYRQWMELYFRRVNKLPLRGQ
jgi:hypothetical protein